MKLQNKNLKNPYSGLKIQTYRRRTPNVLYRIHNIFSFNYYFRFPAKYFRCYVTVNVSCKFLIFRLKLSGNFRLTLFFRFVRIEINFCLYYIFRWILKMKLSANQHLKLLRFSSKLIIINVNYSKHYFLF